MSHFDPGVQLNFGSVPSFPPLNFAPFAKGTKVDEEQKCVSKVVHSQVASPRVEFHTLFHMCIIVRASTITLITNHFFRHLFGKSKEKNARIEWDGWNTRPSLSPNAVAVKVTQGGHHQSINLSFSPQNIPISLRLNL